MAYLFLALIFTSSAFAVGASCLVGMIDLPSHLKGVTDATMTCFDISNGGASDYYHLDSVTAKGEATLCSCLEKSKFNEIQVSDIQKKDFETVGIDPAIEGRFSDALTALVANSTKFESMLSTKDHVGNLISSSDIKRNAICNLKTMHEQVDAQRLLAGTPGCKTSKELFNSRVKGVFGSENVTKALKAIKKVAHTAGIATDKSCVSVEKFIGLRSSPGAQAKGFELLESSRSFPIHHYRRKLSAPLDENHDAYRDLLTYDIIFNLSAQDDDYRQQLLGVMEKYKAEKRPNSDMYNDPEVRGMTFKALNKSCMDFSKNLLTYLCSGPAPRLHATTVNVTMDEQVKRNEALLQEERGPLRDWTTFKYSCESMPHPDGVYTPLPHTEQEAELNNFLGKSVIAKKMTKFIGRDPENSDHARFNKAFCNGRKTAKLPGELSKMTKDYIANLKAKGIDVTELLRDPKLSAALGLKIDVTKSPVSFALTDKKEIAAGLLPRISEEKWRLHMLPALLKKGLNKEQAYQLYTIIEMQTNRQAQIMEDLKFKMAKEDPSYAKMPPAEFSSMAKSPTAKLGAALDSQTVDVFMRYQQMLEDTNMSTDNVEGLFFGEKSPQDIKLEAAVYNKNSGSYQPDPSPGAAGMSVSNAILAKMAEQVEQKQGLVAIEKLPEKDTSGSTSTGTALVSAPTTVAAGVPFVPSGGPINPASKATPATASTDSGAMAATTSVAAASTPVMGPPASESSDVDTNDAYMKQLQDRIDALSSRSESLKRDTGSVSRKGKSTSDGNGNTVSAYTPKEGYNYPENIPVSDGKGNYVYPKEQSGELSSASQGQVEGKGSSVGGGGVGGGGGGRAPASVDGGGGAGGKGSSRAAASVAAMNARAKTLQKEQGLRAFMYPRYVPYALIDMLGSVDQLVMLLSLQGQRFHTIEAKEDFHPNTSEKRIRYVMRTFDFIPDAEFPHLAKAAISDEDREEAFQKHFTAPWTLETLPLAKKYAHKTKEIEKKEVTHTFVRKIDKDIISQAEMKDLLQTAMDKLK